MRPETVHKIAQDIRQTRGILGNKNKWFMSQEPSMTRSEGFREIKFWRFVLDFAENALATGSYKSISEE